MCRVAGTWRRGCAPSPAVSRDFLAAPLAMSRGHMWGAGAPTRARGPAPLMLAAAQHGAELHTASLGEWPPGTVLLVEAQQRCHCQCSHMAVPSSSDHQTATPQQRHQHCQPWGTSRTRLAPPAVATAISRRRRRMQAAWPPRRARTTTMCTRPTCRTCCARCPWR